MSESAYRFAPIFLIRMAGVPFDVVERLATTRTSERARELLVRQAEFASAKTEVERLLWSRGHGLTEELFRAWRKAIRTGTMPPAADPSSHAFALCWECASSLATAEAALKHSLESELGEARAALLDAARTALPPYLVFVADALRDRILKQTAATAGDLPPRNKEARAHERHLLLYLQRIAAKNDSLSAYGPEGWGRVDSATDGVALEPQPGITRRETFLERWTAHGAAAALNADSEVRAELAPRLNPNGRIQGSYFVFADTGEAVPLAPEEMAILAKCDGATAAYELEPDLKVLTELAQRKILRWAVEVPALEPHAFDLLLADIDGWRNSTVRTRWLDLLQPIAALPDRFAVTTETQPRIAIIEEATQRLEALGTARKSSDRFLYSAGNPIGEECFRDCGFLINDRLLNEVAVDAEPWIDLWRDCYAFVASRVAAGLRDLLRSAPVQNGAIALPAFLRHCELMKLPLTGPLMVGLAHRAFSELKTSFREGLQDRADAEEWQLTSEDCHFIRRRFEYPKFDEYTYPSADLQLSAKSPEAVGRGEYEWVLAELHPPVALLHHGFYWSCPDKAALGDALASTTFGRPGFHYGFFAADFTAATAVRQPDAMPQLMNFVAPQRGRRDWRTISPAQCEVYVHDGDGDVCLRTRESHEDLGSFARAWVIPLGFHPFLFSRSGHMPRLRCGKVVVQRQSWTVAHDELGVGNFSGVSRDLIVAVERLRAAKGLPRHVYIRPTEQALRRSGVEGRDKDTKPVYIDFESYLFLEIFHRWLVKSGELEITEMLPDPEHLLWKESDGRRTFELRTQIVPRA
ncbi:MAG TPA: hypothetical protein VGP40_08465 [Chthoniobacterales bacterium]|nr:hypothetical protein [Chthoniobacterales bacterium]